MKKNNKPDQNKHFLEAIKRNVFGKKIKKIRKEGLIPANIFGSNFKSTAISINYRDFLKIYQVVKETGIIYLKLEKQELPVLIKKVQKHPITNKILHVDFRKIDLTQKTEAEVPIKLIKASPAVTEKGGVLLTQLNSVIVEALPQNIPSNIEIDLSTLKEIGDEIKISDLKKDQLFEIKTPAEKTIVSVIAHKEEKITPETTVISPEITTEKKEETPSTSPSSTNEVKENK